MKIEKDEYYVISHWPDNSVAVVGLLPRTEKRSRECIAWQSDGGFSDDVKYHVCRFDRRRQLFVCVDTKKAFLPDCAPFTSTAWKDFMRELNA